jgi:hypothetical protein
METIRKTINLPVEIIDDLELLAAKEKRRGKYNTKNFIEDLVVEYVNSHTANNKKPK